MTAGADARADDGRLRLFFAVPLAEDLRAPVAEAQQQMAQARAKVKWVEPGNLHFTLKFLGETPASSMPALEAVAGEVAARHEAFDIAIHGAGAFPRPSAARAIWLGCAAGAEPLTALAEDLETALAQADLAPPEKRPFRAHLTIGRNKSRHRAAELASAIEAAANIGIGKMRVKRFVLMRSQLTSGGAIHTEVAEFELPGA